MQSMTENGMTDCVSTTVHGILRVNIGRTLPVAMISQRTARLAAAICIADGDCVGIDTA